MKENSHKRKHQSLETLEIKKERRTLERWKEYYEELAKAE